MTIHDELINKIIQPIEKDKPQGLIKEIVREPIIDFSLEELIYGTQKKSADYFYQQTPPVFSEKKVTYEFIKMSPDIIVKTRSIDKEKLIAIELETDIDFDLKKSLQQIKKYLIASDFTIFQNKHDRFDAINVVIPLEYRKYAPLYIKEGFSVWLWIATRVWKCKKCGHINRKKGRITPECEGILKSTKKCDSRKHWFIKLENIKIKPHE